MAEGDLTPDQRAQIESTIGLSMGGSIPEQNLRPMSEQERAETMIKKELVTELSAVVLPELGKRDESNNLLPTTENETLDQLKNFLTELNERGADLVSILDVKVAVPDKLGVVTGTATEMRKIAIVRKPKKG